MIVVIDFGSQTTHLIARRLNEYGSEAKIIQPKNALKEINKIKPKGIILSGGPSSVYDKGAPKIDEEIFNIKIPILGICYGMQLFSLLLGGEVIAGKKEYGPATLNIKNKSNSLLSKKLQKQCIVWMSHGDEVIKIPNGFKTVGSTDHVPFAFVENKKRKIFGLQFHPEVEHTKEGEKILKNFISICKIKIKEHTINIKNIEEKIKNQVGDKEYVIGAISGGVDSTVAGILVADAIGNRFIPVYVENGLMREGTKQHVNKIFKKHGISPIIIEREEEMLKKLKGIVDPEKKRKIIGNDYIEVFEKEMEKQINKGKPVKFLLQGTIYSDVIESKGTKHAAKIKSHHNVGGLPKNMKLRLIEPVREFYKDEVRAMGKKLGLSDEFVQRQVFPGPGYAIRIRGEVTKERLEKIKTADKIVLEELENASLIDKVYMSFPVLTGALSTAVKGDGRFFGEVIALRIVESKDVMTSTWAHLPFEVLQKLSTRIVNEVSGISRVVYDISTKPPATMEWE